MEQNKAMGAIFFLLAYLTIGIMIIVYSPQFFINSSYSDYITLTICYFIVAGVLLIAYIVTPMDIFEPIVFITFLYLMLFAITPIINIITNETLFFGVNLMGGTQKATWIFIGSYFAFVAGYYIPKKKERFRKVSTIVEVTAETKTKLYYLSLFMWLFCFFLSILYLIKTGKSISYILTLGLLGGIDSSNGGEDTALGSLSMFSYSLIPFWMYINKYGKSPLLKTMLFILTTIIFLIQGYRFIIVILVVATITMHYFKNNKRPSALLILSLLTGMILMIGVMGFMRDGVRTGDEIDWASFNLDFIWEAVRGNFDIYQAFYGMVQVIPEQLGYSYGSQMIVYTLVMFIPRAVWPDKPYSNIDEVLAMSVSEYASEAGTAFPNIGEFYLEFGWFGCMVFMFLFGKFCGWCKSLYRGENCHHHHLIAYSIILPTLMQLVIRGYTPSNFYLLLFLLLPVIVIKHLEQKIQREENEYASQSIQESHISTSR